MDSFGTVWERLCNAQGQLFYTKTGKPFSYDCNGRTLALRNTNRAIARSQFAKAYDRFPVSGPGDLHDLQGPSYIFAILTDKRVARGDSGAQHHEAPPAFTRPSQAARALPTPPASPLQPRTSNRAGHPIPAQELRDAGFEPHSLTFRDATMTLPGGQGCEWDTDGDVPNCPGLYAFTIHHEPLRIVNVMYVGLTTHLWMVTKGLLPAGVARGGQRYGRPKHAGDTRKRINIEIATAKANGWVITHWLKPMVLPDMVKARSVLSAEEESLITRWKLRTVGWNRG